MISNSKILTVSYGTFSCTLEGFDDSFETMKAIAEYFRDLAADDRYFGAEPPTPDAEMLAKIAERELARRVQAHEDGGKIVLRAEDEKPAVTSLLSSTAEGQPAQPAPATASPDPDADMTARILSEAPNEADAAEEAADPPGAEDATPAAQPQTPEIAASEPETPIQADAAEDNTTEHAADTSDTGAGLEEADTAQPFAASEPEDEAAAETVTEPVAETASPATGAPLDHPDPDSVAAKLRRIRSVVAQGGIAAAEEYSEDEHAQDFLSATAADLDEALAEDDATELQAQPQDDSAAELESEFDAIAEEDDEDSVTAILDTMGLETAADQTESTEDQAEIVAEDEFDEEDAEIVDEFEDTLAQLMADAMPESEGDTQVDDTQLADDMVEIEMSDAEPVEDDETETVRPLSARVIKMKRSEFEAAVAAGELEEETAAQPEENLFSEEDTIGGIDDDALDSFLSPEEEAELQRELAEVEADFTPDDEDDEDDDVYDTADADVTDALDDDEADMDEAEKGVDKLQRMESASNAARFFEEADQQLDEPDSSRRRNAIQHLRAAVAATRAEKAAGVEIQKEVDDTPYRTDLADVVRPRRPRAGAAARSERPGQERPAPLKLVAEQRIDTPNQPVRPRRVTASEAEDYLSHEAPDGSGFSDFVEEMGANSLPELLEAAAAYMADVEGRPQFSRPMLMGKLKEVEGDAFSREDGLRSFGQLLRQGKLQKLKGGRFAVTDETDFRAPARKLG